MATVANGAADTAKAFLPAIFYSTVVHTITFNAGTYGLTSHTRDVI
jgi:hypothetical protein